MEKTHRRTLPGNFGRMPSRERLGAAEGEPETENRGTLPQNVGPVAFQAEKNGSVAKKILIVSYNIETVVTNNGFIFANIASVSKKIGSVFKKIGSVVARNASVSIKRPAQAAFLGTQAAFGGSIGSRVSEGMTVGRGPGGN